MLGCSAAPSDTAAPGGGARPLPPATPRPPIVIPPEQTYVTPRVPYAPPPYTPQPGAYTPPPMGAAPPSGGRSQRGLVAAVLAVAGAVVVLTVILLVHNGSGANRSTPVDGSTSTTSPSSSSNSSTALSATAHGLIGSWHGVVTQYTPGGARQQIEVHSQISEQGGHLVGQHSETTITGSGVGQICEGQTRQRAEVAGTVSFDYAETLNPVSCISHTVISITRVDAGRVAFQETYQTKIGPGYLVGKLIR